MNTETMRLELWAPDGRPGCRDTELHDEIVTLALAAKAGDKSSLRLLKRLARLWCVRRAMNRERSVAEAERTRIEELYLARSPPRGVPMQLSLVDPSLETPAALRAAKPELAGFRNLSVEEYAAVAWRWMKATDRETLPKERAT